MDTISPSPAFHSTLARFRVDGRVAVVTGGGQGIGLAAAQALHEAFHDRVGHGTVFRQAAGEFRATEDQRLNADLHGT